MCQRNLITRLTLWWDSHPDPDKSDWSLLASGSFRWIFLKSTLPVGGEQCVWEPSILNTKWYENLFEIRDDEVWLWAEIEGGQWRDLPPLSPLLEWPRGRTLSVLLSTRLGPHHDHRDLANNWIFRKQSSWIFINYFPFLSLSASKSKILKSLLVDIIL